jgi:ribosome-associated protein
MHALQDLGSELLTLSDDQLATVPMPENLRDAVLEARRITDFEGRRRQLQYVGKLMRSTDAAPIRERVDSFRASSREHTARLHEIERWRERLIEEAGTLAELVDRYPHADSQQLSTLARNARREREQNHPPKSFRALFKALRAVLEENRES